MIRHRLSHSHRSCRPYDRCTPPLRTHRKCRPRPHRLNTPQSNHNSPPDNRSSHYPWLPRRSCRLRCLGNPSPHLDRKFHLDPNQPSRRHRNRIPLLHTCTNHRRPWLPPQNCTPRDRHIRPPHWHHTRHLHRRPLSTFRRIHILLQHTCKNRHFQWTWRRNCKLPSRCTPQAHCHTLRRYRRPHSKHMNRYHRWPMR